MERNDIMRMKELYQKYSGSKPLTTRSNSIILYYMFKSQFYLFSVPSPATFETPASLHTTSSIEMSTVMQEADIISVESDKVKPKLSLDQYLNSHTSEDNESFEELVVESDKKHKEKFAFLYKDEEEIEKEQQQMLALPSIEDQSKYSEKKLNLGTWTYKNRNHIMFNPDGVQLTKEEELELNKKRQEIVHNNTRLSNNPFNEVQSKETINVLAKTQAKVCIK